jgi:hypothetical protein
MDRVLLSSPFSMSQPSSAMNEEQIKPPAANNMQRPRILDYIGSFYADCKEKGKLKCQVKWCKRVVSYSVKSNYNLKNHYEKKHPTQLPDLVAALSSGSKRGRRSSGAR